MAQLKHVQSTLGWLLIGLIVTYASINVIGFISPFWGQWLHPGDPHASNDLLQFWRPITPWFSVCFVIAAWHLAMTLRSIVARVCVIVMGVLIPVAEIGSSFAQRATNHADSVNSPQATFFLDTLVNAYLGLAALIFIVLVWRAVRQTNKSM